MARQIDINRANRAGNIPIQADGNARVYYLQEQGDAQVVVEKFVQKKSFYTPATLGTPRQLNPNQYLIKEDGFSDIGGGMAQYFRHYASIPSPWFSFEEKSVLVYEQGEMMGINYDSFQGRNGFGNVGFNYKGATRKNLNYLAKATRYYVTKETMDEYIEKRFSIDGSYTGQGTTDSTTKIVYFLGVILIFRIRGKGFTGSFLRPNMLGLGSGDNEFLIDANTGYDFPKRLYINAPLGTIIKNDNSECVIAPDRIRLWQPGIYEITRYTASINLISTDEERISVQVFYNFDNSQVLTQEEINSVNVTLFSGLENEQSNADTLNYYLFKDLNDATEQNATQSIPIKVESTESNFEINPASIVVKGATTISQPASNFTEGIINVLWNAEEPKIIINFDVSKVATGSNI